MTLLGPVSFAIFSFPQRAVTHSFNSLFLAISIRLKPLIVALIYTQNDFTHFNDIDILTDFWSWCKVLFSDIEYSIFRRNVYYARGSSSVFLRSSFSASTRASRQVCRSRLPLAARSICAQKSRCCCNSSREKLDNFRCSDRGIRKITTVANSANGGAKYPAPKSPRVA